MGSAALSYFSSMDLSVAKAKVQWHRSKSHGLTAKKNFCHPEPVRVFANGVRDLLLGTTERKADPSHRFAFQAKRVRDDTKAKLQQIPSYVRRVA